MSSPTLLRILELWTGNPMTEGSPIELPFDIEMHCIEQDKLQARVEELETAIDHALDWISIEDNEDSIKILKDVLGEKQRDAPQS